MVAKVDAERAADDRLDAHGRHFLGEFERAEHIVGVGQRQRRLPVFLGKFCQARDGERPFKQRVRRMHMQVHETGGRGRHIPKLVRG